MANIVELREMGDDKLEEMLENLRDEMFNLRFQHTSARLENVARLRIVRREIAQLETVLQARDLAIEAAAEEPEIAAVLGDHQWKATAQFKYEDSAWIVDFSDDGGKQLVSAKVNLNQSRPKGRRGRQEKRPRLVTSYDIAG